MASIGGGGGCGGRLAGLQPLGEPLTAVVTSEEVLSEAARRIDDELPWYETVGLEWKTGGNGSGGGFGRGGRGGGAGARANAAVKDVLAFNVLNGLLDAANEHLIVPVMAVYKELLGAVQSAAFPRDEVFELMEYCMGVASCVVKAAGPKAMPEAVADVLDGFREEMDAVGRFVQACGAVTVCCWSVELGPHHLDAAARHKARLEGLLEAVLAGLAAQSSLEEKEVIRMIAACESPSLHKLAYVPRRAPSLPLTYVARLAMVERVVLDLVDPHRKSSSTHAFFGEGGGGKTLLASAVVREHRVRASFKRGIFWIPVGRAGKANLTLLLESLAKGLPAPAAAGTPRARPRELRGAQAAVRRVSETLDRGNLRCLVVLDDVRNAEVVDAFASTGLHVLVTSRKRGVVSPEHAGLRTQIGEMTQGEALEVLRKASGATGSLPAVQATQVARGCGMLPLALGMAGALAQDRPEDPASWSQVHERLWDKRSKFKKVEKGHQALLAGMEAAFDGLPEGHKRHFLMLAVMAPGTIVTNGMLASLWNTDASEVPGDAAVLVNRGLLQATYDGYRVHDLVLEYLGAAVKTDQSLAKEASVLQARHLADLGVLHEYSVGGVTSSGSLYSLAALWGSAKKLDGKLSARKHYSGSLETTTNPGPWVEVGSLLERLGDFAGAEAALREALQLDEKGEAEPEEEEEDAMPAFGDLGFLPQIEEEHAEDVLSPLYEEDIEAFPALHISLKMPADIGREGDGGEKAVGSYEAPGKATGEQAAGADRKEAR